MTNQEAFDIVYKYLTAPDAVHCVDPHTGQCAYTAVIQDEVRHCAVGVLLTPYEQEWAATLDDDVRDLKRIYYNDHGTEISIAVLDELMLVELQHAHDSGHNWVDGKFNALPVLTDIAARHHLTVPK
jgi:hypothetical protein